MPRDPDSFFGAERQRHAPILALLLLLVLCVLALEIWLDGAVERNSESDKPPAQTTAPRRANGRPHSGTANHEAGTDIRETTGRELSIARTDHSDRLLRRLAPSGTVIWPCSSRE